MTTREKIIVGIMCLTIVYGVFELTAARKSSKTPTPQVGITIDELKSFVSEVNQKLNSQHFAKEYQYMINQAGLEWDKDPFIHSSQPLQKRLASEITQRQHKPKAERANFTYSGFMQSGTTKIAIINGLEYIEGESLADKTHYVKSISPQRVAIGKVQGTETIQLPISEFDSGSAE